jgi:hypothetical protein
MWPAKNTLLTSYHPGPAAVQEIQELDQVCDVPGIENLLESFQD